MHKPSNVPSSREQDVMVLLLTWVAGSIDAVSFLGLGHVFTANMTGNTVLLGLALGQGQGLAALRSLIALAGYVLGVAIAGMILERRARSGAWSLPLTWALFAEAAVLGVFTLGWHFLPLPRTTALVQTLIALSAVAMGMQSAAARRLGLPGIATTYITGTITTLVDNLVNWPARSREGLWTAKSADLVLHWERSVKLQATVFLLYGLAAVASSVMQTRFRAGVTLSPLIALAVVVMRAFAHHRQSPAS